MKTTNVRTLALVTLATLGSALVADDSVAYAQILKERERVLSQILKAQESRRATGLADEEAIFSAQVSLYLFRRDTAANREDKVKHQSMIVAVHEKKLAIIKEKAKTGAVADVEVLRTTDGLLREKQALEELRAREKTG
jgi:hypothetical protein